MSPLSLIQSLGISGFNIAVLSFAHQSNYCFSPLKEIRKEGHGGKEAVFTGLGLKGSRLGNRAKGLCCSQISYQHIKAVISRGIVRQVSVFILYKTKN